MVKCYIYKGKLLLLRLVVETSTYVVLSLGLQCISQPKWIGVFCSESCIGTSRLLYLSVISDCNVLAKQNSYPVPPCYCFAVSAPLGYLQMSLIVNVYIALVTVFSLFTL